MALTAICVARSSYTYVAPSVTLKVIALDPPVSGRGAGGTVQYMIATAGSWVVVRDDIFGYSQSHNIEGQGIGVGTGTILNFQLNSFGWGYTESLRVFVNPDPNPVPWDKDSWWFYGWHSVAAPVQSLS